MIPVETRRRALTAVLLLGLFHARARAQAPAKVWRIGFLGDGSAAARAAHTLEPVREGLRELGYIEGRNLVLDVRWSEGSHERLVADAAEFVRQRVDLIITHGVRGSQVAKKATTSIPIVVAAAADLVGAGLVASLARPGGNVTGNSDQASEVSLKQVELISELVPGLREVAILWNRLNGLAARTAGELQSAARARRLKVIAFEVARREEMDRAVDAAGSAGAGALIVVHDAVTLEHRAAIARQALVRRLPTVSAATAFAEAGILMSYGPDLAALCRRAAIFVDKILKGTPPGNIPVEQPTRFELVVNLRTASALGVAVPPAFRFRADRLLE
jgi:putative ABC transport system substrate-binding protein